jgi:hypothetical protein
MAVARLVGNLCGSAKRGTSAVPLGCREAGGELERSLGLGFLAEHFGMRGTVTDAWEPATSTVDYRGLGRVGTAAEKDYGREGPGG